MPRLKKTSKGKRRRSPLRALFKLVFYPLVAVVAVLVGLSLALQFVPERIYRPWALRLVNQTVETQVTVDGDLALTLWPRPALLIGGLSLAASFGDRPLLEVGEAEAALSWTDLLDGQVRIGRIDLAAATLNLEIDADGRRNWKFSERDSDRNWFALLPADGSCRDCRLDYHDRQRELSFTWRHGHLELRRATAQQVRVSADGLLQDMQGHLTGTVTALPPGQAGPLPIEVDLNATLAGASARARGTSPDLREWRDGVFQIESRNVTGDMVEAIAPWTMPPIEFASLDGLLDSSDGTVRMDRIRGTWTGGPDQGEITMTGSWDDPGGTNVLDLEFQARSAAAASMAAAAGIEPPFHAMVNGTATLSGRARSLTLASEGLVLEAGTTVLRGHGSLHDLRDEPQLALDLDLTSDDLASVGAAMDSDWPGSGPLRVNGRLEGSWRNPALADGRLQMSARGMRIDGRGAIADLRRMRGFDVTVDTVIEDLEQAVAGDIRSYLPAGTGQGSLTVRDRGERLNVNGSLSSDAASMSIKGDVDIGAKGSGNELWLQNLSLADATLDVDVSGDTVLAAAPWLEGDLNPVGPARARARLRFGEALVELSRIDVGIGASSATGRLTVTRDGGSTPRLGGRLEFPRLDLDALLPAEADDDGMFLSDEPLPLDFSRRFDADVEMSAGLVRFRNIDLRDAALHWTDSGRRLRVLNATSTVAGGSMTVNLDAEVGDRDSGVRFDLALAGLNPEQLPMFEKGDVVHSGTMDLTIRLDGRGASLRDILTAGTGEVLLEIDQARLPRTGLNLISTDLILLVLRTLNPFVGEPDHYDVECGVVGFRIAGGKAVADRSIGLLSDRLSIVGGGVVDLETEAIDFALKPKPRRGFGLNASALANLVHLGGTLENPRTQTNPSGILRSGAEIGAAVATGGLSLVLRGLFDRFTGGEAVCPRALDFHRAQVGASRSGTSASPASEGSGRPNLR